MAGRARQAFLGVGANLGDRWATICGAQAALARTSGIRTVEPSAVYETAPVGVRDQPEFLNLVLGIETTLTPEELLAELQSLETAAGRRREGEVRWGPRPLDLDLLLYEGETRTSPGLILPHPRMWERAFVTVPLRELFDRAVRFQRPAWTEVRERLAPVSTGSAVRRWVPPAG
jgi:2-amino-4-hydroxy-6-hydroxymethyldihydropteridine diphosphokinase